MDNPALVPEKKHHFWQFFMGKVWKMTGTRPQHGPWLIIDNVPEKKKKLP